MERVSCFPNEGDPEVIPGEPVDGDIIRVTTGDTVLYQRYTAPVETPPPAPAPVSLTKAQFLDLYAANDGNVQAALDNWP